MKIVFKVVLVSGVAVAAFVGVLCASFYFASTTKLQKLDSPKREHHAELIRTDFIDRNYVINVDGVRVYRSPDFAPRPDLPYRETLVWDATGKVVILEIAGHRVFGFDTSTNQRLTDAQLLSTELPPDPPLWEYSFEGEWPGIGRVLPPEAASKEQQPQPAEPRSGDR